MTGRTSATGEAATAGQYSTTRSCHVWGFDHGFLFSFAVLSLCVMFCITFPVLVLLLCDSFYVRPVNMTFPVYLGSCYPHHIVPGLQTGFSPGFVLFSEICLFHLIVSF